MSTLAGKLHTSVHNLRDCLVKRDAFALPGASVHVPDWRDESTDARDAR